MNIHLVLNRRSRAARAALPLIEQALLTHGASIDVLHDVGKDDISVIGRKIKRTKPDLVIIGGGDGTVSSLLHSLAGSKIELGIVPLGTTNNFARSLNLPTIIEEAIDIAMTAKARPVDLGTVNGQYFANVVSVGLSTVIAKRVTNKAKRKLGRLAYLMTGLRYLPGHRAFTVTLRDKDGELAFSFETRQVIVANGRFHAGKKIAADAEIDNRELVVFALGGRGWLSFVWHTLDFYLGRRKKIVHSSYVVGNAMFLETNRRLSAEIDGETGTTTPLSLKVEEAAIQVRYEP